MEIHPKNIIYSKEQHIFLVAYELSGGTVTNEVVLYWENTDPQFANSKVTTVKGLYFLSTLLFTKVLVSDYFNPFSANSSGVDAAFVGNKENQFAILDEDKTALSLYMLPGAASQESFEKNVTADDVSQSVETEVASIKGPMQFMFESEVDRIFSTPLGA